MGKIKEEFDALRLRIDPIMVGKDGSAEVGRQIVADKADLACHIAKDRQSYSDDAWRVELCRRFTPSIGYSNAVQIVYQGSHALPESKRLLSCPRFSTGAIEIRLCLIEEDDKSLKSGIYVSRSEYADMLETQYGIRNGYFYEAPDQDWSVTRLDECELRVVSDGHVVCKHGDSWTDDPGVAEFEEICREADVRYEVFNATWTVVCRKYFDEERPAEITLYTRAENFVSVFEGLEKFLIDSELTRFEDLL